ncbi:hypothetical protein IAD21_02574 [Abditibacteriota bacterium]|nr:hypothetical protein IAD21_02574 [Abditibacteriota bacterium]
MPGSRHLLGRSQCGQHSPGVTRCLVSLLEKEVLGAGQTQYSKLIGVWSILVNSSWFQVTCLRVALREFALILSQQVVPHTLALLAAFDFAHPFNAHNTG